MDSRAIVYDGGILFLRVFGHAFSAC